MLGYSLTPPNMVTNVYIYCLQIQIYILHVSCKNVLEISMQLTKGKVFVNARKFQLQRWKKLQVHAHAFKSKSISYIVEKESVKVRPFQ